MGGFVARQRRGDEMLTKVAPWLALVAFAHELGWTPAITPRGRLRLTKGDAAVFGPPPNADAAACKATIFALGEAEGFIDALEEKEAQ
jgi:hypothetical protein